MSDGSNPYAPPDPSGAPPGELQHELIGELSEMRLRLYEHRLELWPAQSAAASEVFTRDMLPGAVQLHDGLLVKKTVALRGRSRQAIKLSPEDFETFATWMGGNDPAFLRAALTRNFRWNFPIGVLFALTSLPVEADPEAGLEAMPFDPLGMGLGVALILMSVAARTLPHRIFFFLDAVWFVALAARQVFFVVEKGHSPAWLLFVAVMVVVVNNRLGDFLRFAPNSGPKTGEAA